MTDLGRLSPVEKQRLTDSTKGPLRRLVTVIALVAAVLALLMTLVMVVAALSGWSSSALRTSLVVWVLSLFVVFGATQYLKSGGADTSVPPDDQPKTPKPEGN